MRLDVDDREPRLELGPAPPERLLSPELLVNAEAAGAGAVPALPLERRLWVGFCFPLPFLLADELSRWSLSGAMVDPPLMDAGMCGLILAVPEYIVEKCPPLLVEVKELGVLAPGLVSTGDIRALFCPVPEWEDAMSCSDVCPLCAPCVFQSYAYDTA